MAAEKKNKIHNPQFITETIPSTITKADIGRIWVDKNNARLVIGLNNTDNNYIVTDLLTGIDKTQLIENMSKTYFSKITDIYATIIPQINGDKHYDQGYDFFNDSIYLTNSTQELDDYYSFFYVEVPTIETSGYLRTISTSVGEKHIRNAIGSDNYVYNSQMKKVVNYSKIILPVEVKSVIEIKFENKDIVEQGFELETDNTTILIYCDPEGFFLNKKVKIRCLM